MASNASFLRDLLSGIAERGRGLLDRHRPRGGGPEGLVELCEELLSGKGEATGMARAQGIVEAYAQLSREERLAFFGALLHRFGPDFDSLDAAVAAFRGVTSEEAAARLHDASEPRRQELIRRINMAPGGTAALVAMRKDLLAEFGAAPELAQVDRDFAHLFASWFNRGFLVLQRIDWSTPAAILEKIIRYEAVHAISDWADLRRRIDPPDRRCFAFFHPSLADDPLIFVEVALTGEAPEAIGPILAEDRKALDPRGATTAVFYSISNCQRGLAGISFGSFLIKQVAEELAREFPGIKTFVTLSPMPLFRGWLRRLEGEALDVRDRRALQFLEHETWANKASASRRLKAVLEPLAAHYLMRVKRGDGRPFDPVARFHLGNGAQLEKLNWMADKSAKGMAESAGLMVNYRYVLSRIEQNHEAYANTGEVIASASVRGLLRAEPREVAEIAAP